MNNIRYIIFSGKMRWWQSLIEGINKKVETLTVAEYCVLLLLTVSLQPRGWWVHVLFTTSCTPFQLGVRGVGAAGSGQKLTPSLAFSLKHGLLPWCSRLGSLGARHAAPVSRTALVSSYLLSGHKGKCSAPLGPQVSLLVTFFHHLFEFCMLTSSHCSRYRFLGWWTQQL
jgi:hypothetical protein